MIVTNVIEIKQSNAPDDNVYVLFMRTRSRRIGRNAKAICPLKLPLDENSARQAPLRAVRPGWPVQSTSQRRHGRPFRGDVWQSCVPQHVPRSRTFSYRRHLRLSANPEAHAHGARVRAAVVQSPAPWARTRVPMPMRSQHGPPARTTTRRARASTRQRSFDYTEAG
jgi:hypothetical protein